MRKHGGKPFRRDKHLALAVISLPGVARPRFVGGQQSGLAGCKPPPLFMRRTSSCPTQERRQGEPWGASPRPSAPTYLPTYLGMLNSIISPFLINQALEHPKKPFFGVQTDWISVYIPRPTKRCQKWVFSPREPGRAIQLPTSPNLGVLSSIISLIPISPAMGHPKMRFSGSRVTEFPFIIPPQTVPKMRSFTS